MPRYAAFLRGVSPMNCSMPALTAALEAAGFGAARTVLSSGNAVFEARAAAGPKLEKAVEAVAVAEVADAVADEAVAEAAPAADEGAPGGSETSEQTAAAGETAPAEG